MRDIERKILQEQIRIEQERIEAERQAALAQDKRAIESAWDITKEAVGDAISGARHFAGGAVGETIRFANLPAQAVGGVGKLINMVNDRARYPELYEGIELTDAVKEDMKARGMPIPEPFDADKALERDKAYNADFVDEGANAIQEFISGEDRTTVDPYAERVGEFASPTGILGKAVIERGGKLLKKGIEDPKFIERMFMDAAKNPKKFMQVEQEMSFLLANLDKFGEQQNWPVWARMLSQIGASATYAPVRMVANRLAETTMSAFDKYKSAHSTMIQDYLLKQDEAMGGKLMDTIERNRGLADKYGMPITDTAHLSKNRELKEAQRVVEGAGDTVERERTRGISEALREKKELRPDDIEAGRMEAEQIKTAPLKSLDDELQAAEAKAKAEAEALSNVENPEDVGGSFRKYVEAAEDADKKKVSALYGEVGMDVDVGNEKILQGIKEAKRAALKKNEWGGELDSHMKEVLKEILGSKSDDAIEGILDVKGNVIRPFEDQSKFTLEQVDELQKLLKERMRKAQSNGDKQLHRALTKVLSSTYKQLEDVPGLAGEQVEKLRTAVKAAKESAERFNNANTGLLTKVDKQNDYRVADEDVVKQIVKNDKGRGRLEAVDAVYKAVGDKKKARRFLERAFKAKLAREKSIFKDDMIDEKKLTKFIKDHSDFLRRSGLSEKYKGVGKHTKLYDELYEARANLEKQIGRDAVAKWYQADDPVKYVTKEVLDGRADDLIQTANGNEKVLAGLRESLWEGLMDKTVSGKGDVTSKATYTGDALRKILDNNRYRRELTKVLGKEHMKAVEDLVEIMDIANLRGAPTSTEALAEMNKRLTEQLMTGTRAALRGFVRPDFIFMQGAYRIGKERVLRNAKQLLKEVLNDPEKAKKLLEVAKQREGKALVRNLFLPLFNTAQIKEKEDTENE